MADGSKGRACHYDRDLGRVPHPSPPFEGWDYEKDGDTLSPNLDGTGIAEIKIASPPVWLNPSFATPAIGQSRVP